MTKINPSIVMAYSVLFIACLHCCASQAKAAVLKVYNNLVIERLYFVNVPLCRMWTVFFLILYNISTSCRLYHPTQQPPYHIVREAVAQRTGAPGGVCDIEKGQKIRNENENGKQEKSKTEKDTK